jgi:hypothetical protein
MNSALLSRLMGWQLFHHEHVLGVVAMMLEFDVLVERSLAAIGFIALVNGAYIVPGDLHGCPTHSFAFLGRTHVGRV